MLSVPSRDPPSWPRLPRVTRTKTMGTRKLLSLATLALSLQANATPKDAVPAQPVQRTLKNRTSLEIRWQKNATAREQALEEVRARLRPGLNLASALQIALLNNRDFLAAFEEIGVSAADLREAGLWKNPRLDLSVRFPNRAATGANWEETLGFDLLEILLIPLRKRVAADQLAATQLRVTDAALRLVAEVKIAMYHLQADTGLIDRRKIILEIQKGALDVAQRQHEAGNISDLVLAQQQAVYNTARLDLLAAETAQRQHREEINRLLSLWGPDTAWELGETLPVLPGHEPDLRGLESLAVAQRQDLAAAQKELSSVVRALGLTKSYRYVGALSFGANTERETDGAHLTGPQLSLELPLFNQGQARVARGEAELRRAERKVEALAIGIRAEVRAQYVKLSTLREKSRFYESQVVPTRRAITEGMLLQYNGMLVSNFRLFETRAEQIEAEHQATEVLRDYWVARAELERAVGGSLRERLPTKAHMHTQTP